MIETRTVTGELCLEQDESYEEDKWLLRGEVEWNGVRSEVKAYLEDILSDYDGHVVEITIKVIEAPKRPPQ